MDFESWWWIGLIPFILIAQIYFLGRKMSEPEKMIQEIPGGLPPQMEQAIAPYKEWLGSVGLSYLNCFKFGSISVAVYQHESAHRFFSFYFHQKLTFAMESYLEDLTILDTGTSGTGGLFPRPGAYMQSLPGLSPQQTWLRHVEAEEYLSQKFGYAWVPLKKPYMQILPEAMRVRMQYNRSQPFWPVRVLYRFFVTRNLLKNRTIAQQYP